MIFFTQLRENRRLAFHQSRRRQSEVRAGEFNLTAKKSKRKKGDRNEN
jgi:hypothetical protein